MIVPAGAISPHRLLIVTGHFGTGKTEFSVNLALALARAGEKVMLADLDIVNPYFRSRERRAVLESAGVRLITSSQDSENADMPSLPGDYCIVALEPCWIKSNQIEAARIAMTRYIKRGGKVWIKIFPDKPVTA